MAITDLTGTTWKINSSFTEPSALLAKHINFVSDATDFAYIDISPASLSPQSIMYANEDFTISFYVCELGSWIDEAYRTISITGGNDASDSTLIAWLEANAVQVFPADISITYKGAEIAEMSDTGTKILKTQGKYCEDDITIEYTKPSAPTPILQAKTNIAPTTSSQTITPDSGYDGLSSVQINAMPTGSAGTPSATKSSVSNNSVTVTPSVINTTGYITGGTKTGTAVTVSASELVSGTKAITANGTVDVTNYADAYVNITQNTFGGTFTPDSSNTVQTLTIPYTGSKYPIYGVIYSYTAETAVSYTRGVRSFFFRKTTPDTSPKYSATNPTSAQGGASVVLTMSGTGVGGSFSNMSNQSFYKNTNPTSDASSSSNIVKITSNTTIKYYVSTDASMLGFAPGQVYYYFIQYHA